MFVSTRDHFGEIRHFDPVDFYFKIIVRTPVREGFPLQRNPIFWLHDDKPWVFAQESTPAWLTIIVTTAKRILTMSGFHKYFPQEIVHSSSRFPLQTKTFPQKHKTFCPNDYPCISFTLIHKTDNKIQVHLHMTPSVVLLKPQSTTQQLKEVSLLLCMFSKFVCSCFLQVQFSLEYAHDIFGAPVHKPRLIISTHKSTFVFLSHMRERYFNPNITLSQRSSKAFSIKVSWLNDVYQKYSAHKKIYKKCPCVMPFPIEPGTFEHICENTSLVLAQHPLGKIINYNLIHIHLQSRLKWTIKVTFEMSWNKAAHICSSFAGYLPSLNTREEVHYLLGLLDVGFAANTGDIQEGHFLFLGTSLNVRSPKN